MSEQLAQIRRLIPVLDMVFRAEQLKMTKILNRITLLKRQLADLDNAGTFDPITTTARGGADLLWETWVQNRKRLITRELAFAARDREATRGAMVAALSQLEAARQLETRSKKAAALTAARRADC